MFRGEIWELSLSKSKRSRAAQTRRVVLLSSDSLGILPLRVVIPLVPWSDTYLTVPWMVRVPPTLNSGLDSVMAADALQVRSVQTQHLLHRVGELPRTLVDQISRAVNEILEGG
ncbi:MAG: type II toxin-antitoxin system PemK/MazF family toxin [Anaerolineaceae bacterium]